MFFLRMSKATTATLAIVAIVVGMLLTLVSAAINSMPDDEPLDTNVVVFKPDHVPSVAEPPPDSRRSIRPLVVQPPVVVAVVPVQVPATPKPARPIKPKPTKPRKQSVKSAPTPFVAPTSTPVETAIAFAMAQLGKPYKWGATGPGSYDCSGLVQRAFRVAGVELPRSTSTIINKGKSVSRQALLRGDLIWTSSGHMGIYLGGNKMIHSPETGDVVKISTVWSFYAGRRL